MAWQGRKARHRLRRGGGQGRPGRLLHLRRQGLTRRGEEGNLCRMRGQTVARVLQFQLRRGTAVGS